MSTTKRWLGRILSAIVILLLLFDGIIKLIPNAPVLKPRRQLGYSGNVTPVARGIGALARSPAPRNYPDA